MTSWFSNHPNDLRRFNSVCRHCPGILPNGNRNETRDTSYYCSCCMVGLHPHSFQDFHKDKPEQFRANRPPLKSPHLRTQSGDQI